VAEKMEFRLPGPSGDTVYVKDGFSWPAFFFGAIWALYKKAWILFFMLAITFGCIVALDELIVRPSRSLLLSTLMLAAYIAFAVVCGKRGNSWIRRDLERKGYTRAQ
jgi:Protein of unknown function (DUF2628)